MYMKGIVSMKYGTKGKKGIYLDKSVRLYEELLKANHWMLLRP